MLAIAGTLSSNIVTALNELDISNNQQIEQIVVFMPVFFLRNSKNGVFINIHEFIFVPGALECLLSLPSTTSDGSNEMDNDIASDITTDKRRHKSIHYLHGQTT